MERSDESVVWLPISDGSNHHRCSRDWSETKDAANMTPEELQSTLEARELRFTKKNGEKNLGQALMAQFRKKGGNGNKLSKNKNKFNTSSQKGNDKPEFSNKGGGGSDHFKKSQKFDKKKVPCYNCVEISITLLVSAGQERVKRSSAVMMKHVQYKKKVIMGQIIVLLIATINEDSSQSKNLFFDTGCSNHMTSHKEWLIYLNARKSKVRFADYRTLQAEGTGNLVINKENGNHVII